MRVLVIAQLFPPDMGGGATRAYNVAKGLALNGCDVVVVTAFPHYPSGNVPERYRWKPFAVEIFNGFRVIKTLIPPIPSEGFVKRFVLFLSFAVTSLFAIPLVGDVDVIWAANPNIISFFPALIYWIFKRKPVALNVDDLWPGDLQRFGMVDEASVTFKLMRFLAKFAYFKASLITPISPGYVGVICGKYGVSQAKVRVVRAGVDLSLFTVAGGQHDDGNKFKVVYSGAFSVAYDFEQVLLAAEKLRDVDDVEFVLQGGGELIGHIKSRVEELRLDNVKVINKIVSRLEVAQLLGAADTLLLPLRDFGVPYQGISSKLYEYQAAGKPVICCAEGQPARYIRASGCGVVVKPGDYKTLAETILFIKKNGDIAESMGILGRQYVKKNLSIKKIGLIMMVAFNDVLNHSLKIRV